MDSGLRRNDIAILERPVTLYAIYAPRAGRPDLPAAIPEKFSWTAAILPPVYLLAHGLWLELLVWTAKLVVLVYLARVIGGEAASALYLLGAIWLGFAASGLRRDALTRRGWRLRGHRVALSAELAQLGALR